MWLFTGSLSSAVVLTRCLKRAVRVKHWQQELCFSPGRRTGAALGTALGTPELQKGLWAELWALQNHPFPTRLTFPGSCPVPQRKENNIPTLFLAT